MNNTHIQQLEQIMAAINILSPTGFSFAGHVFSGQEFPALAGGAAPMQPQNPLIGQLQQVLYTYTYLQPFDSILHTPALTQQPEDNLMDILSQANASRERWETGWQIAQIAPSGQILAHKHGATRTLWAGEFVTQDGPGTPPRVGAMISIYSPRESKTIQPAFYFAFGETIGEPHDIYEGVRFYWNVGASGAVDLVRSVTERLNRFQIPFRFKCCSYPSLFYRLDSAVLYVHKRHYRITAELLVDVYRALRPHLEIATPIFTRRLAPGLAFAEEPGTGESFGTFCCRVVAEAIWNAYMQGTQSVQSRLETVKQQFDSYEIDIARPYLRSGSVDIYEFPAYS